MARSWPLSPLVVALADRWACVPRMAWPRPGASRGLASGPVVGVGDPAGPLDAVAVVPSLPAVDHRRAWRPAVIDPAVVVTIGDIITISGVAAASGIAVGGGEIGRASCRER